MFRLKEIKGQHWPLFFPISGNVPGSLPKPPAAQPTPAHHKRYLCCQVTVYKSAPKVVIAFPPSLWPGCQQPLKTKVPAPPGTLSSQRHTVFQASWAHHERGANQQAFMNVPRSRCQRWASSCRGHTDRSPGNRRPVHALCQVHGLRMSELIHDCKSKACRPTQCSKGQVSLKGRSSGSSLVGSLSVLMGVQGGSPGGQNRQGVWEPRLSHMQPQKEARAWHINPFERSSSFSGLSLRWQSEVQKNKKCVDFYSVF